MADSDCSDDSIDEKIQWHTRELERLPRSHSDRAMALYNLAAAFSDRYDHTGTKDDLNRAIPLYMEALELLPPGGQYYARQNRAMVLHNLACVFSDRYESAGAEDDFKQAVQLQTEALELRVVPNRDRAMSLDNLAITFRIRYDRTGSEDLLAETIRLHTEALKLYTRRHTERVECLNNLAMAFRRRYDRSSSSDDLEEMIRLHRDALKSRGRRHPDRVESLNNLANSLRTRFERTSSRDDLAEMTQLLREALKLCPPGHPGHSTASSNLAIALNDDCPCAQDPDETVRIHRETLRLSSPSDRARHLDNLAVELQNRFDRAGSEEDLEEMIRLGREALELRKVANPDRPIALNNLAAFLKSRYDRSGSENDLKEMIQLWTEALELRPLGNPDHIISLNNLATAIHTRYDRSGSLDDLAEAIRLHAEAFELCPRGHTRQTMFLNNLANVLRIRYDRTGSEEDLEKAIRLLTNALDICKPGHPGRVFSLNNLANALHSRYDRTGSQDVLEQMIQLLKEALNRCPRGDTRRDVCLSNLANALSDRYNSRGSLNDLEEITRLRTEGLELRPHGHPDRGSALNNLASAYMSRYGRQHSEDDLEKSIALLKEALTLHPGNNPYRATSLNNLGEAIRSRYRRTNSQADLEEMTRLFTEALEHSHLGHQSRAPSLENLADAMRSRYDLSGREADIQKAIQLLLEALELRQPPHPKRAFTLTLLAYCVWSSKDSTSRTDEILRLIREGATDLVSPLHFSLSCTKVWITLARQAHHATLDEAYDHAIRSLRRYLTIGPTIKLQYNALEQEANMLSLPMDAAAHAIASGNVERAVEWLDGGRALLWSETRRFREPLLHPGLVGDALAEEFETTRAELQTISTAETRYDAVSGGESHVINAEAGAPATGISYDILLSRKRKLLEKYESLLEQVRKKPGCEDFLRSPPFGKLKEAAREGPIIIVNCSELGSHVIIVFADRPPSVIPLDDDFREQASRTHEQYASALQETKGADALDRKLRPIMRQLWGLVVSEVVLKLQESGVPKGSRIWWCPTSFLTALPLHAAGSGKKYLIDSYVSSYTPTLKALIDARKSSSSSAVETLEPYPRLLVVNPPDTNLPSAKDELKVMRSLGPFVKTLDDSNATQQSVLQSLQSHNWAHFICHGTLSQTGEPFDSALHLYKGDTLSLNDIIKAHLPDATFAFLAACHTAEQSRGASVLQDEVLHLAGAMQVSGFRSVVGTLWEMEDEDGPNVARLFYEKMLEGSGDSGQRHTRAAHALRNVALELKRETKMLSRWVYFVHIGA